GKSGDNNPDDDLCSSLASPLCEAGESSESGNAGFRKSFSRISGPNGGDLYNVRGVLSIPFPNTAARKAVAKAEVELRRATTLNRRVRQRIVVEVRETLRRLEASYRGIAAADQRRRAAAEQLRAERVRLSHGESTPFDVLLREDAFVEAESQRIGALQTYRTSAAAYERAVGATLDAHDLVIRDRTSTPEGISGVEFRPLPAPESPVPTRSGP
ncbi:MAG: TolC family protein, partial [Proteobacteria bacterium]|nr:TolC family protein [Pseudomonadota bacterium]